MTYPLVISGTTTVNGDQSVTLAWTIKDSAASPVTLAVDAHTFEAGYAPSAMVEFLLRTLRATLEASLTNAQLPANFSFSFGLRDLI